MNSTPERAAGLDPLLKELRGRPAPGRGRPQLSSFDPRGAPRPAKYSSVRLMACGQRAAQRLACRTASGGVEGNAAEAPLAACTPDGRAGAPPPQPLSSPHPAQHHPQSACSARSWHAGERAAAAQAIFRGVDALKDPPRRVRYSTHLLCSWPKQQGCGGSNRRGPAGEPRSCVRCVSELIRPRCEEPTWSAGWLRRPNTQECAQTR